jgi:hypothetical protein
MSSGTVGARRIATRAGLYITAAAACTLATTAAAGAATSAAIHKTPCTRASLAVYYETNHKECFSGVGDITVRIPHVTRITTGSNAGSMSVSASHSNGVIAYRMHETIGFSPSRNAELTRIHNVMS